MTVYLTDAAAQAAGLVPPGNKYHARPACWCPACAVYHFGASRCPVHGLLTGSLQFDSGAEATRHADRALLVATGEIVHLRVHTRWKLVVAGVKIGVYESDLDYQVVGGPFVVEDIKNPLTAKLQTFQMHRALMRVCYQQDVTVIMTERPARRTK